jgi:hypothetical protein
MRNRMPRDLGQLQIESVVLHQVPDKSAGEPDWHSLLSEAESELTPATRNYLLERIVKSLASAAYEAVFDSEASSPIPELVADYHEDEGVNFIDLSRQVAQYLYGCQNRPRQGGLLTVIQTSNAGRRSLVILKMEQDEAVGLQRKTIAGKATYSWEHRTDLALNSHRRVLKVGLFERRDSEQTITALVSDKQKGYSANKEVADFFLKRFLGCKLAEAPEVTTKRFFQITQDFINGQVEDSITKAKYYFALLAELNSQQDRLDPSNFAMSHLNLEHRKPYEDFCVRDIVKCCG